MYCHSCSHSPVVPYRFRWFIYLAGRSPQAHTGVMKAGFITCLLALLCLNLTSPQPSTSDIGRHLSNCVTTISQRHFPPRRLLALDARGASRTNDLIYQRLHQITTWPIVQLPSAEYDELSKEDQDGCRQEPHEKPLSYVLLTDVQHFAQQVRTARAHSSWNPRALFLVVVTDLAPRNTSHSTTTARQILATLWNAVQVVNTAVLVASSSDGVTTLDAYTWFPFHPPENCAGSVRAVTLLDRWSIANEGTFLRGVNLFPQKFPKNLHGCPVHVAIFEAPPFVVKLPEETTGTEPRYGGLEVQLLATLADVYNFSIVYRPLSNENTVNGGGRLQNGSWTGVFDDVISSRANISLGCFMPTVARFCAFDFTKGYATNAVVWVVPKAKAAPRWLCLYNIFSPSLWLLLFLVYNISVLVVWLLARTNQSSASDPTNYRSLSSSYHLMLGLHLGVSSPRQPRTNRLRAFFLLVACYSLWIDTAYQSSLISSLTNPNSLEQISSVKQLLDSDLTLNVYSDYKRLYESEDSSDQRVLRRIVTHCGDDIVSCLKTVIKGGHAVLANRALVQFHKDGRGRTQFRVFRSNAFTYFVGMVLPKGSILLDPFNDVIRRLNPAYLIPKWRNDLSKSFKSYSVKSPRYVSKKIKTYLPVGPQKLTVLHLQGSFMLLCVRCVIALGVFIGEVTWGRPRPQPPPVSVFMQ